MRGFRRALVKLADSNSAPIKRKEFKIKPPDLLPGVVPADEVAPVLAMDSPTYSATNLGYSFGYGFPGFSYLSNLTMRAEYRAFASVIGTEITREWIEFTSNEDDANTNADKIKEIEEEFIRLKVRDVIATCAENDCYFGRAQIFIDIDKSNKKLPLILDPRAIKTGSLRGISSVEPIWTTPKSYNALDPSAPDFYKPSSWFMLGQEVHASRLLTIITRKLPDILKPAFNFAGMSLSQLAEPYVDNWLRTRQSISDLISNFSITVLATAMDQVLQGNDDGADLLARADFFIAARNNKNVMLLDKEREEIVQINTPLSGLHELQAQSQEHMCTVSRIPAVKLTGLSPTGMNASSEGEIRVFYDWTKSQQESYWRDPIDIILKVVQLSLFGEIDPSIGFKFVPLYQMTEKEQSDIRLQDSQSDTNYINAGVIDPSEPRKKLAHDPNSGYLGLDVDAMPFAHLNTAEEEPDPIEVDNNVEEKQPKPEKSNKKAVSKDYAQA